MTNPRFAPEFRVNINDAPVPASFRASISGVTLHTGLEGSDRVELNLVNENLRWLDHPLIRLDNELTLSIGYAPDPLTRVFAGEIVTQTAAFPNSGFPTLTVAAQDRRRRLQEGTKARWFAIRIPDVAAVVAAENGLLPIFDPVGAAIGVILGGAQLIAAADDPVEMQKLVRRQDGECDCTLLSRIAAENGWEMVVEHAGTLGGHKLRFFSPLDRLKPDLSLKYGQSLIDFSPRISNVGQIVSVTAFVWVARIKTRFAVTVGWDWDRSSLTIDIRPAFTPAETGPSDVLIKEPVTLVSAPRKIISELIPRLNKRVTASGSTVGDPRIQAGAVLQLEGLGVQFGGLYRVTSATHTIDGGGYRTSFELRKEIWFGMIPLAQQAAVPLRVLNAFAR
jgi:phage protein D